MLPERVQVKMLGDFSLRVGDHIVSDSDNRSRKVWLLLAYLIHCRGHAISQDNLVDLLWGDVEKVTNPVNALKTMFHRLRSMLDTLGPGMGHSLIIRVEGSYQWNPEVITEVDADRFEALTKSAAADRDSAHAMEHATQALALYRGDFLPKLSAESWTVPISAYFHNLYVDTLLNTLPQLEKARRPEDVRLLCAKAVDIEPYNEAIYLYLMRAYLDAGDQHGAIQIYEEMRQLFFDNFGIMPSDQAQALYREAVRTGNERAVSITTVQAQLMEADRSPGALFCDYDFFRVIYQAESRMLARSGFAVHIALMSATTADGDNLPKRSLDRCMENLHGIIISNLRRGDIASQCSSSQYILMLPQANYENSCMVCDRIIRAFSGQYPHSPAKLRYAVQPLEPFV